MSDLSSMIDATTERLLRKIDNWEVPQSDKKHVTIKRTNDLYEQNLEYIDTIAELSRDIERLQKQLDIAVKALTKYSETVEIKTQHSKDYYTVNYAPFCDCGLCAQKALADIKELNK